MNEHKLYFLAYWKHGQAQHLVAGPFVSNDAACIARHYHKLAESLAIVSTELTFTVEEDPNGMPGGEFA